LIVIEGILNLMLITKMKRDILILLYLLFHAISIVDTVTVKITMTEYNISQLTGYII